MRSPALLRLDQPCRTNLPFPSLACFVRHHQASMNAVMRKMPIFFFLLLSLAAPVAGFRLLLVCTIYPLLFPGGASYASGQASPSRTTYLA